MTSDRQEKLKGWAPKLKQLSGCGVTLAMEKR